MISPIARAAPWREYRRIGSSERTSSSVVNANLIATKQRVGATNRAAPSTEERSDTALCLKSHL